ncbi:MAG: hypothetical protein RL477_1939, partial [Pseudomonadota bacterium]
ERFYEHVGTFGPLRRIIQANSTVDALKTSLRRYILSIGCDMENLAYVEQRLRIGQIHCKIGLEPRWYLGAFDQLEAAIQEILAAACAGDMTRYLRLSGSLRKIMKSDVSLGIDAYHEDSLAVLQTTLAKIRKHEQELRRTSRLDGLTGVLNRKAMMHALKKEIERSDRYGHPMAVLFVDLDHFKNINDSHGHAFGDRVIKSICAKIRETIRLSDILARYGGEEFVVTLVECSPEDATRIAERLRRIIAGNVIQKRDTEVFVQVTVSIGMYLREPNERDPRTVLRLADRALYAAKKTGRNRVVVYSPELGS